MVIIPMTNVVSRQPWLLMPQTIAGTSTPPRLEPPITIAIAVARLWGIQALTADIEGTNPPIENPIEITK